MNKQVLVACGTFELIFFALAGFNLSVLGDPQLLVFNALFVCWLGMEAFRVRLGHSEATTTGKFSRAFLLLSFTSTGIAMAERIGGYSLLGAPLPGASFYAGLMLMLGGIYLRHLSIKTLGQFFVTKVQITDDHRLIKEGIYKFVRHPSYTGLILGFFGAILLLNSSLAVVFFLLAGVPAYIYRIKVEERALLERFGQEYTAYRNETCALVPLLF